MLRCHQFGTFRHRLCRFCAHWCFSYIFSAMTGRGIEQITVGDTVSARCAIRRAGDRRRRSIYAKATVAEAVSEWGQQDVKDLQPVQKVLAKRTAFNRVAEVPVARRDDAHVRLLESRPAEALILAFLDET